MFKELIDIIFPKNLTCYVCGRFVDGVKDVMICSDCMRQVEVTKFKTEYMFLSTKYYLSFSSVIAYNTIAKKLLMKIKYNQDAYIAHLMGEWMLPLIDTDVEYIVPVPVSKKRQKKRGYNQSALIADVIARFRPAKVKLLLRRSRDTKPLKSGTYASRLAQINKAISIDNDVLKEIDLHGKIMIIDDVYTTGATLHECSRVLYELGATNVHACVFAERMPEERKRIMNVNNLKNCNKCGRMFSAPNNEDLCERCRDSYNSELRQIKDFLYESPNAQIREIAEGTGISTKIILRFIKEGKIILASDDDASKCERCGAHIHHGRFCNKCVQDLTQGLKAGFEDKNKNKIGYHTKK